MKEVILVVEDQQAMLRNICIGLEMARYEVLTAVNGLEALAILRSQPVDLVLADVGMPLLNGYQLYEQMRRNPQWALIPFIFISARGLDSDVRYGKMLGADDYLVKPFQLDDLLAIVGGRLRRAREIQQALAGSVQRPAPPLSPEPHDLVIGPFRINPRQHRVWRDDTPLELSPREFKFLEYLARRPDQVVSLSELCQVTHGLDVDAVQAGGLLYQVVRSLRRRLGYAAGEMGVIESVRGIGYRIVTHPDIPSDAE